MKASTDPGDERTGWNAQCCAASLPEISFVSTNASSSTTGVPIPFALFLRKSLRWTIACPLVNRVLQQGILHESVDFSLP